MEIKIILTSLKQAQTLLSLVDVAIKSIGIRAISQDLVDVLAIIEKAGNEATEPKLDS